MPSSREPGDEPTIGRPKLSPEEIQSKQQTSGPAKPRLWYQRTAGRVIIGVVALYLVLLVLVPPERTDMYVSPTTVSYEWPFTVDSGTVRCEHGSAIVLEVAGRKYALNGVAQNWANQYGYEDVRPIRRRDPRFPDDLFIPTNPLILDAFRELCE